MKGFIVNRLLFFGIVLSLLWAWKLGPVRAAAAPDAKGRASLIPAPGLVTMESRGTVQSANQPLLAGDDAYSVNQDTALQIAAPGILANDSDPEGTPITATLTTDPANGAVSLNGDGSFTYTPNAGFAGTDSFNYQDNDGLSTSNVARVSIQVKDTLSPSVDWSLPSVDEQVVVVGKETIQLQVSASDNVGIVRVQLYRWDAVNIRFVDIANLTGSPFQVELDASQLNPGWNQVFARSYDAAGNFSERKFIWLYRPVPVFLPLILTR